MSQKRPLHNHNAEAQETEDESCSDRDDDESAAAVTADLMSFRGSKRRKDNGSLSMQKGKVKPISAPQTTPFPFSAEGTAWLKSAETIALRSGRVLQTPHRRPLGDQKADSIDSNNFLNVGKNVFSWALGKLWNPVTTSAPSLEDTQLSGNTRLGFTFMPGSGGGNLLSSSILSEENVSFEADVTMKTVTNVDQADGQTDLNTTQQSEEGKSETFFTPEGSPEKRLSDPSARRSILSPRSPGLKGRGPRVSINRTPQVREIASRAAQARNSSLIWQHRDLDEKECLIYRVGGSDLTPDSNEKPAFLSAFPFLTPTNRTNVLSQPELPDDEVSTSPKTLSFPTPPEDSSAAVTDTLSPRTLGASAIVEFAEKELLLPRLAGRSACGRSSYQDILATAKQQQDASEIAAGGTPTGRKRRLASSMPSPYLPLLLKRGRRPANVNTVAKEPTREITVASVDVPTGKPAIKLPRLMPPLELVDRVRPKLIAQHPAPVPAELCRPVEEMLIRKRRTPWLPPTFPQLIVEDEEEEPAAEDEDEDDKEELNEEPEAEEAGAEEEQMDVCELEEVDAAVEEEEEEEEEEVEEEEEETSGPFDRDETEIPLPSQSASAVARQYLPSDVSEQFLSGMSAPSVRDELRGQGAELVDSLVLRLQEKLRKAAEARKLTRAPIASGI
ncbi:hypothetical protein BV898_16221 [Hypsibius exemplaris]|uniref:Uncharacterized protein n=1 Tax=Hypsibius exemplaris TaxID=2072580 RepID=A0A9X6NFJ8_HYPEX|nr:hypothetical protein BV898_16221 [Hypsibius exemplaris]